MFLKVNKHGKDGFTVNGKIILAATSIKALEIYMDIAGAGSKIIMMKE